MISPSYPLFTEADVIAILATAFAAEIIDAIPSGVSVQAGTLRDEDRRPVVVASA